MTTRTFRIARPLARLAEKQGPNSRRVEGHFPPKDGRTSHVVLEGPSHALVLTQGEGHERVDIPEGHARSLLDVAPGRAEVERTTLAFPVPAALDRYTLPTLDLVHVPFGSADEAAAFVPPAWLGEEVTGRDEYAPASLAIKGVPEAEELTATNEALDSLLDQVDSLGAAPGRDSRIENVVEDLSRLLSEPTPKPVREVYSGGRRSAAS